VETLVELARVIDRIERDAAERRATMRIVTTPRRGRAA
jgi:hypothetical protein